MMTRYEWHMNKAAQLADKATLIVSAVGNLTHRVGNRMYDIWMEHIQLLANKEQYHLSCAAGLTVEDAQELLEDLL